MAIQASQSYTKRMKRKDGKANYVKSSGVSQQAYIANGKGTFKYNIFSKIIAKK